MYFLKDFPQKINRSMNEDNPVVSHLLFYKFTVRLLVSECKLDSSYYFSFDVPCIASVIARYALYCTFSILF